MTEDSEERYKRTGHTEGVDKNGDLIIRIAIDQTRKYLLGASIPLRKKM